MLTLTCVFVVPSVVAVISLINGYTWIFVSCMLVLWVNLKQIQQNSKGRIQVKGQGIFITGCDTGFGHDVARRLDELGFTVFAGCLHPTKEGAKKLKSNSSKRLHIVPLDVGSDVSVKQAHDYVYKHLPATGLWGVINNAGFNVMGDVELLTTNLYQKVMNVNLYGAVRTFRNFLYLVRRSKGRVVVVTSVKGLYPWPYDSAYHVTKHGLETLTDSLRLEMVKFGVNVSLVEPGNFSAATGCQTEDHIERFREEADEMWNNASDDVKRTYGRRYLDVKVEGQKGNVRFSALSTRRVVDALVDAITSDRPETRYLVHGGTRGFDPESLLAYFYDCLPTFLSDWIIIKMTGCDKLNKDA